MEGIVAHIQETVNVCTRSVALNPELRAYFCLTTGGNQDLGKVGG